MAKYSKLDASKPDNALFIEMYKDKLIDWNFDVFYKKCGSNMSYEPCANANLIREKFLDKIATLDIFDRAKYDKLIENWSAA